MHRATHAAFFMALDLRLEQWRAERLYRDILNNTFLEGATCVYMLVSRVLRRLRCSSQFRWHFPSLLEPATPAPAPRSSTGRGFGSTISGA